MYDKHTQKVLPTFKKHFSVCIVCVIFQNLKKLANNLYQEQHTTQYKRLPCEQDKTCGMRGRGGGSGSATDTKSIQKKLQEER